MTEGIQIPIKRTGFPVQVGEVELWFDSSFESLRRVFNIEELTVQRLEEVKQQATHIHFPAEINEDTVESVKNETIDSAFDVNKEFIAIQWDLFFGNGTFKDLYKVYPDIIALEEALDVVGKHVAQKINEEEIKRSTKYGAARKELLDKKNNKKKIVKKK